MERLPQSVTAAAAKFRRIKEAQPVILILMIGSSLALLIVLSVLARDQIVAAGDRATVRELAPRVQVVARTLGCSEESGGEIRVADVTAGSYNTATVPLSCTDEQPLSWTRLWVFRDEDSLGEAIQDEDSGDVFSPFNATCTRPDPYGREDYDWLVIGPDWVVQTRVEATARQLSSHGLIICGRDVAP